MYLYSSPAGGSVPDPGSAVMEVRNAILERVGETGLVDDTQLKSWVRRANRAIYNLGVKRRKDPWKVRCAPITFPSAAAQYDLTTLTEAGGVMPKMVTYVEVNYLGGWFPIFQSESDERWSTEPGIPIAAQAPLIPFNHYFEGKYLMFSRNPPQNISVRMTIIPALTDPADDGQLLGGMFADHHDLVTTRAAQLMSGRDERKGSPWDAEYALLLQAFYQELADRQGSMSRRIGLRNPYYP